MKIARSFFRPNFSLVEKNVLANFVGKSWVFLINLLFVPVYIKFLGLDAYGLVGFFVTLQAIFIVLDLGLSTTLNRELARLSAEVGTAQQQRNLVRTLELIYWFIAAMIAGIIITFSSAIANNWLHSASFSPHSLQIVISLIGIAMACNFPLSLYYGGLMGLQKQVLMNGIDIFMSSFRAVTVTLVLWLVSPSIYAFFVWQAGTYLFQALLTRTSLWRQLPQSGIAPTAQLKVLKETWRFTAGISAITIFAVIITNSDKVILSTLLPLSLFAAYTIAGSLAGILSFAVAPVFSAVFPALTKIAAEGNEELVKGLYHRSCQFLSVIVFPAAFVIVLFSSQLLQIWIRNPVVTENAHQVASLLAIGTALNAIMILPYCLQLSYGWTRLAFFQNLFAVILFVPLLLRLTSTYGAPGAATAWIAVNCGYVLVTVPLMHRRLLKGELRHWYVVDVGLPFLGALVVAGFARILVPMSSSLFIMAVELGIILILAWSVAALSTPATREWVLSNYKSLQDRNATCKTNQH